MTVQMFSLTPNEEMSLVSWVDVITQELLLQLLSLLTFSCYVKYKETFIKDKKKENKEEENWKEKDKRINILS